MKTEIKELSERVKKLSEIEASRRHAAFAAHWFALSETERQLAGEVLDEFEVLRNSGQVSSEADCEKYHASLTPEKHAVTEKMLNWRTASE